jgi:hypothetical protein
VAHQVRLTSAACRSTSARQRGTSVAAARHIADRTALGAELAEARGKLRRSRARHDPGRVLVDIAVAVADGATTTLSIVDLYPDGGASVRLVNDTSHHP